jgi:tetratricopeptide (TPR) repeat protein
MSLNEYSELEELCQFQFNTNQSRKIGEKLFDLLNDKQQLVKALKEADAHGERLILYIHTDVDPETGAYKIDFPFELLYHPTHLITSRIHIIRKISAYGHKKRFQEKDRLLKMLFIACSPLDVEPALAYEKEEEAIFEVINPLPVTMDVEDTGSFNGLKTACAYTDYDIIHITGHANIDEEGPYFCMEDEEGFNDRVRPHQLWKALRDNKAVRLIFLSGCRTGQHGAAFSFAHQLVNAHSPPVVGWGLPVTDPGAREAAKTLYHELGKGASIPDAVFAARRNLYEKNQPDWWLLRLFSDGTPLTPLVEKGQKKSVKRRDVQYKYLEKSNVRVLETGFVGRRRQIQYSIKSLKDKNTSGLLLHGTGGLGKSCLAGKVCERFSNYKLIIVHGELNTGTFLGAVKDRFLKENDDKGLKILDIREDITDKINRLCSSSFQKRNYLILLDDFERNLVNVEEGTPFVGGDAAPIVYGLLQYLPDAGGMTRVIITSRYTFSGMDELLKQLAFIGLTTFRGADERKKIAELKHINDCDERVRQQLIEGGRGNPRLMEAVDALVGMESDIDWEALLATVKGKQDEFVQNLVLNKILERQSKEFQQVMQCCSVYRLPVAKKGIELVCEKIKGWDFLVEQAVQLSLVEKGRKGDTNYYGVTPLLREELVKILGDKGGICHKAAVMYYEKALSARERYEPDYGIELIDHALHCGEVEIAVGEGGRLLSYLRNILAYKEAEYEGMYILSQVTKIKKDKKIKKDERFSRFLFELGWILKDIGKFKEAITCYEQALSIDREVYGERHPDVATRLNNLGGAWDALGKPEKAINYYEQALSIDREVYGERHPAVATRLNNLGSAWDALGKPEKAINYIQQAYDIFQEFFGDQHPHTKTVKEWLDALK